MRSLGMEGIPTTGLDWELDGPGFKSRYCDARVCPNPKIEPERLLAFLLAEGNRLDRPAVLIPTSDTQVMFMSRYRSELSRYFLFNIPDATVVEAICNKRLQYALAERVGVRYPQTAYAANGDDIAHIKHDLDYPVIMKPCYSEPWFDIFGHKGFRVNGPEELERRWAEAAPYGLEVVVQRLIPGSNLNHYAVYAYLNASSEMLGLFTKLRLHQYPIDLGNSTLAASVRCHDVDQVVSSFLKNINYRGFAQPDFRRDPRDGQLNLIELNPRIGEDNIHATRLGVNLLLLGYLDLTGQKPEPRLDYPIGVRHLVLVNDWRWFTDSYPRGEATVREWLQGIASARSFGYWEWRDPLPFLAASNYGLQYLRLPLVLWRLFRRSTQPGARA